MQYIEREGILDSILLHFTVKRCTKSSVPLP